MRKSFFRRFAVLLFVLATVVPVSAAPRQDDYSSSTFLQKLVRIIRHILPMEEIKPQLPTP